MFLFSKRTKKAIKYIWGTLATLVALSMVITYSGFTSLSRTQTQPTLTQAEMDALLAQQQASGTPPVVATGTAVTATLTPAVIPGAQTVPVETKPNVPKLDFSI